MNASRVVRRLRSACALSSACLALATPVTAATFCVDSEANLRTALNTAHGNGTDDSIFLVVGTYFVSTPLVYSGSDGHALSLFGGYAAGCHVPAYPGARSTIDGQGQSALISASGVGNLRLSRLVWQNGIGSSVIIYLMGPIPPMGGNILIEQNVFGYNTGTSTPVSIHTDHGRTLVRNSLFIANTSQSPDSPAITLGGSEGSDDHDGYFNGNTLSGNQAGEGGKLLRLDGTQVWSVANNIFWNNAATYDLDVSVTSTELYYNDIANYFGTPIAGAGSNLAIDPRFANTIGGDFSLRADSPLLDAGFGNAPGGLGVNDLADHARVMGAAVDVGAYERPLPDLIFADGFD